MTSGTEGNYTESRAAAKGSEKACNGHSTHVDGEIRNVTEIVQMLNEQASTGTFVPRVMATYCHTNPLLATPNRSETVVVTNTIMNTVDRHCVGLSWSDKMSKALFYGIVFIENFNKSLPDRMCSSV